MTPHLTLLKNLMDTSGRLWRLVKFKDQWGKTFFDIPPRSYEEALREAMRELEKALQEAGIIHVWVENAN